MSALSADASVTPIRISVDTGGTFTDAVVDAPAGAPIAARSIKVLSSSAVRARILSVDAGGLLRVETIAPAALVRGWRVRGAGVVGTIAEARECAGAALDPIGIDRIRARTIEITLLPRETESLVNPPLAPGSMIDLRAPWPAPILAARLLLGCGVGRALPPLSMRLGTTRGTNAMLEGRVDSVLLVANEGLGDALAIGDQRRDRLFDPAPRRRPALHAAAIEATLRQDRAGRVTRALDEHALLEAAASARARSGTTHAAILFMHAWRNPDPERRAAELLRGAGFARVVASHECTGAEGYLARGAGAVADAALSSAVGDFIDTVRRELAPGSTLEIATSAAALRPAPGFPPRESLLSGPAGGAAGVLAVARTLAVTPALGFDMGGTSTDAVRIDGDLPRRDETPIAGRTLAVPSIAIESVAAGGGSVCAFESGCLRVGPGSAGADPGPACYGRGGPLTITDVDLLLGRADPARFAVPIDPERARAALRAIVLAQSRAGIERDEQATLETLRDLADDAMSAALRAISVREGFDPTHHSIVAFGGAGGQHACAIADRLGARRIVHPFRAGLLSAAGILDLRRERVRSEGAAAPLDAPAVRAAIARCMGALGEEAPPRPGATLLVRSAHASVGWRGQSAVIEFPVAHDRDDSEWLVHAAAERYRAVFGTGPPSEAPELSLVRVVAEWVGGHPEEAAEPARPGAPDAGTDDSSRRPARHEEPRVRMRAGAAWVDARLVDRRSLAPGARIEAPAIVADDHSTLVIDPGWSAVVADGGAIVLDRQAGADTGGVRDAAPEIRAAALAAIATEMGEQLRRTSVSVNVRDRLDYSCGILDAEGLLATTAPHVPVHLGALGSCVRSLRAIRSWHGGDVVVTNDPAFGGSHLPDVTVVLAVGEPPIAFVAARAHHAEIGGTRPGSMPPSARTLEEEGVVIPPTVIGTAERGRAGTSTSVDLAPIARMLRDAPFPSRAIDDNLADLAGAIAALRRGAALIESFMAEHGADGLRSTLEDLRRRSHALVVRSIERLPAGFERRISQRLDDGAPIELRLSREGARLRVDFGGSSGPHAGNLNAPLAVVRSAVMYAMRLLVETIASEDDRALPLNDGLLEPVDLVVPPGLLDPPRHAPVAAGNTETSQRVVDALLLGLGIAACSQGTMNNLVLGGAGGPAWSFYETIAGGIGATSRTDGADGLHAHMTNTRITDPEILERRWPLRLRRFAFRRGSGGRPAAHPGGDGLVREIEFLEPAQVSFVSQRRASGPEGLAGGGAGFPGRQRLVRADGDVIELPGIFEVDARQGDRLTIETPGGGGCASDGPHRE